MLNDSTVDTDTFDCFIFQVQCFPSHLCLFFQYVMQLQKGANNARSDDVRRIKEEVANWINQTYSPASPLSLKQRDDRGLQNDITGCLLCPIEHSWDDDKYIIPIYACPIDIYYLIVFVARFKMQNSIYLRIISSLAFIPRDLEIQMMWKAASCKGTSSGLPHLYVVPSTCVHFFPTFAFPSYDTCYTPFCSCTRPLPAYFLSWSCV
jgi:hypothetical protein